MRAAPAPCRCAVPARTWPARRRAFRGSSHPSNSARRWPGPDPRRRAARSEARFAGAARRAVRATSSSIWPMRSTSALQHVVHAAERRLHAAIGIALFGAQIGEAAGESFVGGRRIERRMPARRAGRAASHRARRAIRRPCAPARPPRRRRSGRSCHEARGSSARSGAYRRGLGLPIEARAEITDHALEGADFDDRRRRPIKLGADLAHQPFQRSCVERRGVDSDALIDLVVQRTQRLFERPRVDDRL